MFALVVTDVFSDKLAAWRDYTDSPWGRIRYLVGQETLRREAGRLGPSLRILDVGGGDGMDAIPLAEAGHEVTVLDQSPVWLDEARRRAAAAGTQVHTVVGNLDNPPLLGQFDMVLCHFVLQYRAADGDDAVALAGFLRRGGTLSVMLPNPAGSVLRQLIVEGPQSALAELGTATTHAATFDHTVRKIAPDDLATMLSHAGLTVLRQYGLRVANDLVASNDPKYEAAYFDELLRLELALCDQEPFNRIGGMYQLIATTP